MRLDQLLALVGHAAHADKPAAVPIRGIACDSRRVEPGDLFVAVRGSRTDGARFAAQALERGAVAVAAEEVLRIPEPAVFVPVKDSRAFLALASSCFYGYPLRSLKMAAVTGTNGKTTTTCMLETIFRHAGLKSCLAGTLGMKVGTRHLSTDRTTPEAPETMRFLRRAVDSGCTHGAMEVSSHALCLKRVYGFSFAVGVFTNLTVDHLDFHGDMESYYAAKKLLFTPEGGNGIGRAAINFDDPYGRRLAAEAACPVVGFGFDARAEVRCTGFRQAADGVDLELDCAGERIRMRTRLLGRPNASNALAAFAAARALGLGLESIRQGIEAQEGVPGRMESIRTGQPFLVLVDYAHTPDALAKLLATVAELPHGRIILVFGCGGDRDRGKRPVMGAVAAAGSDHAIATSDNPRSEDPAAILAAVEEGLRHGPAPYRLEPDRRRAIAAALSQAAEGDIVVIAGKGHETSQVIGDKAFPFDDREVARELLLAMDGAREASC